MWSALSHAVLEWLWISWGELLDVSRKAYGVLSGWMFLRRLDSFDGTFTWLVARMCSSISRMYIEGGCPGGASLMVSSFLRPCQSRWLTLAYIVSSLDIFPSEDRHQRQIWICLWLRCRVWDIMAVSIRYSSGQEEKDIRSVAPINARSFQSASTRFHSASCSSVLDTYSDFLSPCDLHGRRISDLNLL